MQEKRKNIQLILGILLLGGLLWSRALLSITIGLWLIYSLACLPGYSKALLKNPLLIWSFAPLLLVLTGMYPQPFAADNLQLLLTFCVYPVAGLAALASEKFSFTKTIAAWWIHAAFIAMLYPLGWFALHMAETITQYGSGKSLPVFMDNDHLRFGIFLCSALLLSLLPGNTLRYPKAASILLLACILFLSVRTAWVMAFIIITGYIVFRITTNNTFKKEWLIRSAAAAVLILTAFLVLPTANQKIRYTIYDWQQYNSKGYDSSYSDGVRRAVNSVAWKAIQTQRSTAIGWQAVPTVINKNFRKQFNGNNTGFGWPFNQWLFWWMGSGWWGMALFTGWLFYPAWYGWRHKNPFLILWTLAIAASCLVECTLNYQFGALLHVWPLVLVWTMERSKASVPPNALTKDPVISEIE
jgi:hypothetical protein